jgi:hypothetical protein
MPSASFASRRKEPPCNSRGHSIELHRASLGVDHIGRNVSAVTPNLRIVRPILFQYRALTYVRLSEVSQLS